MPRSYIQTECLHNLSWCLFFFFFSFFFHNHLIHNVKALVNFCRTCNTRLLVSFTHGHTYPTASLIINQCQILQTGNIPDFFFHNASVFLCFWRSYLYKHPPVFLCFWRSYFYKHLPYVGPSYHVLHMVFVLATIQQYFFTL